MSMKVSNKEAITYRTTLAGLYARCGILPPELYDRNPRCDIVEALRALRLTKRSACRLTAVLSFLDMDSLPSTSNLDTLSSRLDAVRNEILCWDKDKT